MTVTVPQVVELPGGRTMTVRAARPSDTDGLQRLYDGLPDDDRYRRFFSLFRPGPKFFEKLVTFEERGGLCLVVEVTAADADLDPRPRIVGEADYSPLANGDAEFAITVAPDWRGWMGPFLLDTLARAAAERGIPNLEADILTTNGPMIALIRSRGFVSVSHPDWTVSRVSIGAANAMPTWPTQAEGKEGEARPLRVLVEVPGARWRGEDAARAAGAQLLACPGPDVSKRCPALAGAPCPLAALADVIVMARPRDTQAWRDLATSHGVVHPGVPVVVEGADAIAACGVFTEMPAGAEGAEVVAALEDAAGRTQTV